VSDAELRGTVTKEGECIVSEPLPGEVEDPLQLAAGVRNQGP